MTTQDDVGLDQVDDVPVYEAGVSRPTAEAYGLTLGQTVPLTGDPGDPLIGRGQDELYAFAT